MTMFRLQYQQIFYDILPFNFYNYVLIEFHQMYGNNNEAQQPNLPSLSSILKNIPPITKAFYFTLSLVWLCTFFVDGKYIAASRTATIDKLYIWQFFTSMVYVQELFLLLFVLFNAHTFMVSLEQKIGSFCLLIRMLSFNIIIITLSLALQTLMSLTGFWSTSDKLGVAGLWFMCMTLYCLNNPSDRLKLCCCEYKLKLLYYPWVLLGLLSVFYLRLRLEMVVGIFCGILQHYMLSRVVLIPTALYKWLDRFISESSPLIKYNGGASKMTKVKNSSQEDCFSGKGQGVTIG